jgi:outer membrane protein assembly factor BamE (lipoprotein component of BamABCDE complex)
MRTWMVAIAFFFLYGGCGTVVDGANLYTSSTNRSALNKLAVGMNREEVIAIMGTPHKREADGRADF